MTMDPPITPTVFVLGKYAFDRGAKLIGEVAPKAWETPKTMVRVVHLAIENDINSTNKERRMRILVFSAHSADYCARAGGTIVKHIRAGARVTLSYAKRDENQVYSATAIPILILGEPEHFAMNSFLDLRWIKMGNCLPQFACSGRQLLNLNDSRVDELQPTPCHSASLVQIENC